MSFNHLILVLPVLAQVTCALAEGTADLAHPESRFDNLEQVGCLDLQGSDWCMKKCPNSTTCSELRCQRLCMVSCGRCTPTPEDCKWSPVFWGPCNATCGGGTQSGVRMIEQDAKNNGTECAGDTVLSQSCNEDPCQVDCAWDSWSTWTPCSRSCNSGTKKRDRSVAIWPSHGGVPCPGVSVELAQCGNIPCPAVNCEWNAWQEWTPCTTTCGGGIQERHRNISREAINGGDSCQGAASAFSGCNDNPCPAGPVVNCTLSAWTAWGTCSATCGGGTQLRSRFVDQPAMNGGSPCSGESAESQACGTTACPGVNCTLSAWTSWGTCSATCGGGTQRRSRFVDQPAMNGGWPCSGESTEFQACETTACATTTTTRTPISTTTTTATESTTTAVTAGPSKFIMVTTGSYAPYVPHFFSLSPEKHPLPSCLNGTKQALGSAIANRQYAALFPGEDKHPIMCGGGSSSEHDKRRCIKYDAATDEWAFTSTNAAGGGNYQFWDYNPQVGLIMAGGIDPQSINMNISRDNGLSAETLTNFPYGWCSSYKYIYGGCLVIINETTVFVAGGQTDGRCGSSYVSRNTYFYNINTDTWTRGPDMSRARTRHTCNLVTHIDGTQDIVVVGGLGLGSCSHGNRDVDIIHLDSNSQAHRSGASVPIIVYGHTTAVYGDKIVLMGGYESSSCSSWKGLSKAIFEYDAWNNTWTKLDFELPNYSRDGSAMFVDDNICDI